MGAPHAGWVDTEQRPPHEGLLAGLVVLQLMSHMPVAFTVQDQVRVPQ
jgi:hypothetical protein